MYNYLNKTHNTRLNNRYMYAKTASMFEWENLPKTIPSLELERLLQRNGYAFIYEHENNLYAFNGNLGGEVDVYGNPTQIIINNVALNLNKTISLDDGVLLINDSELLGLEPLFSKYNTLIIENEISLVMMGINSRIQTLLSASDDVTRKSAELYLEKIKAGELGVIGESALFDGIKAHSAGATSNTGITSLVEYQQYLKANLYNEIGISANHNMKRERLTANEAALSDDALFPLVDNMMMCRLQGVELLNAKYDLNVLVGYGSIWSIKKRELVDNVVDTDESTTQGELPLNNQYMPSLDADLETSLNQSLEPLQSEIVITEDEPLDEPSPEPLDEPSPEPLDEPVDESLDKILEIENLLLGDDLTPEEIEQWNKYLDELKGAV